MSSLPRQAAALAVTLIVWVPAAAVSSLIGRVRR